ncbi:MAG: hypothetical protein V4441_10935 [Pseudomonadota bacterium]
MLSPANLSYSEDYWRDRCGMPPRAHACDVNRVRIRSSAGRALWRKAPALIGAPFRLFAFVAKGASAIVRPRKAPRMQAGTARAMQASLQASLQAKGLKPKKSKYRLSRMALLKLSLAVVGTVWAGGFVLVYVQPAPASTDLGAAYVGLGKEAPAVLVAADAKAAPKDGAAPENIELEGMLVRFADANEAALVALRGYLITGSEGFLDEWQEASARLAAAQMAIEVDSRDWTDGARIMQLRDLRGVVAMLKTEEETLAGLAVTPNRYPGLRLYRETTERALTDAEGLLDVTLASVMQSNRQGAAVRVDTLAHIRGDLRALRASLDVYLTSSAKAAPTQLMSEYVSFRADLAALAALRNQVGPNDQSRLDRLTYLFTQSDTELGHIMALKPTPRWDYADFAFKQKVLPLSEKISSILGGWRG